MNRFKYLLLFCTVSTLFLINFECHAVTKKDEALWAIAATQKALTDLQADINEKLTAAIFEIGTLKEGEDLTDKQVTAIKTIVNRIKTILFNIPTCVDVQNYNAMVADKFAKGKAEAAAKK